MVSQPLVRAKKEETIGFYRTSYRSPELVLFLRRYTIGKKVSRIKGVIAKKLPGRAMKIITACLGKNIDLRTWVTPILGSEVVGQYSNFLNGVRGRIIHAIAAGGVIEIATVKCKQVHIVPTAVHVHCRP